MNHKTITSDQKMTCVGRFNTVKYGTDSLRTLGPHEYKMAVNLKQFTKLWSGPKCSCNICKYINWHLSTLHFTYIHLMVPNCTWHSSIFFIGQFSLDVTSYFAHTDFKIKINKCMAYTTGNN